MRGWLGQGSEGKKQWQGRERGQGHGMGREVAFIVELSKIYSPALHTEMQLLRSCVCVFVCVCMCVCECV